MNRALDESADKPHLPSLVEHEHTCLRLPSRPEWIEPVVDYLRHKAVLCGLCPEEHGSRVALVLQEALSNSVIHGNLEISSDLKEREGQAFLQALVARAAEPDFASRSVEVLVQYDGAQCQWIITDEGQGFPVEKVLGEDHGAEPALIRCSGRGIILMRLDGWRAL